MNIIKFLNENDILYFPLRLKDKKPLYMKEYKKNKRVPQVIKSL